MYLTCTHFPRTLEWTEQIMGIGKMPMRSIALPSFAGRLRKNRRGFRAGGFSLLGINDRPDDHHDPGIVERNDTTGRSTLERGRTQAGSLTLRQSHPAIYARQAGGAHVARRLVSAKYIGYNPRRSITRQKDWHPDSDDMPLHPSRPAPGINDVHPHPNAFTVREYTLTTRGNCEACSLQFYPDSS